MLLSNFAPNWTKKLLKGQLQGHTAMLNVNTPRVRRAFVENFSDAPRAQDNLSKLLPALSAIAAPSAGTLQNLCTFLVRVPALGAAMAESAISNSSTRARWAQSREKYKNLCDNACWYRFSTNDRYWCSPRVKSAVKKKSKICVTMLVDIELYVYCNS